MTAAAASPPRITVTSGADRAALPAPRRLQLTAEEFSALAALSPAPTPPWFTAPPADTAGQPSPLRTQPDGSIPGRATDEPAGWERLLDAGVVTVDGAGSPRLARPVAVTMALLAAAPLTVQLAVGGPDAVGWGWWALDARGGAGLLTLPGGGVEITAFLRPQWAHEITRAVPPAEVLSPGRATVAGALTGTPTPAAGALGSRRHRLPLAALAHLVQPDPLAPSDDRGPGPDPVDPALRSLLARPRARLAASVWARTGAAPATGGMTWLAAPEGWLSLRAAPRLEQPEPTVDLVPVQPRHLARELAPLLQAALTVVTGGAGAPARPDRGGAHA